MYELCHLWLCNFLTLTLNRFKLKSTQKKDASPDLKKIVEKISCQQFTATYLNPLSIPRLDESCVVSNFSEEE